MSRYRLVPENSLLSTKEVLINEGLVTQANKQILKSDDKYKDLGVKRFLMKLQDSKITSGLDGELTYRGRPFHDFNYQETICDFCSGHVDKKYEPFYNLLDKCNILDFAGCATK